VLFENLHKRSMIEKKLCTLNLIKDFPD